MTVEADLESQETLYRFSLEQTLKILLNLYPLSSTELSLLSQMPQAQLADLLMALTATGCQIIESEQKSIKPSSQLLCEILEDKEKRYWICSPAPQETPQAQLLAQESVFEEISSEFLTTIVKSYQIYLPLKVQSVQDYPHLKETPHWFWATLKPLYRVYASVALGTVFINIFALFSSVFSMNVYDRVVPNGALETLYTLSFGMLILYSFDLSFKILRSRLLDSANKHIDITLSTHIFEHLLKVPLKHKPRSLGGFSSLVAQFESFREFFASATMATLVDLPFMLLFIGMIAYIGGSLVWTQLVTIPLVAIITVGTQWLCQERVKKQQRSSAQKQGLLIEALYNLESIKFWGAEEIFARRWAAVLENSSAVHGEIKSIQTISSYLCQMVQSLSYVLMVTYGVLMILEGSLTMGALIGCSILSSRALAPVLQIGQLVLKWQQAKNSYEAMNQLVALPSEVQKEGLSAHNIQGHFECDHISFSYQDDQPAILEDLSCVIRPGERIGIVGPNASGKSTFLKMLLGLYTPTKGQIRLDGCHLQQFHLTDLRQQIGYVPQDVQLVAGTLKDNLLMGCRFVSQDHLMKVLEDSGVLAWISGHPKGLDMIIEERGQNLSGGQRQSIGLARALMHQPKILLLDEPTSALDFAAEAAFLEALERCLTNQTLVIVSHRHAPLKLCKEVLIFQQGRIVKRQSLQTPVSA